MKVVFYSLGLAGLLSFRDLRPPGMKRLTNAVLNQEYAALEKNAPVYPHVSQFNGDYCIIEYTVTATGSVKDAFPEMSAHRII